MVVLLKAAENKLLKLNFINGENFWKTYLFDE